MRYERGNVVIEVSKVKGFGKNPGLWIGTTNPNTVTKVAVFRNDDMARMFCKWFVYMMGLTDRKPYELEEDEKHGR